METFRNLKKSNFQSNLQSLAKSTSPNPITSLSLAFNVRFSHLLGCLQKLLFIVVETIGVLLFICKFLPKPFELFQSEIAILLYKI
jgi:hypothetical protein